MKENLGKFIKYNNNLIHLDLSYTRLDDKSIKEIGANLRKAKSLIAIHFSGNPGVTEDVKNYIYERIHARTNKNYDF